MKASTTLRTRKQANAGYQPREDGPELGPSSRGLVRNLEERQILGALSVLLFLFAKYPIGLLSALAPQHKERGDHLLTNISDSLRVWGAGVLEGLL